MTDIISKRYSSKEMSYIFSNVNKYGKWRLVWYYLAESQYELGFPIDKIKLDNIKKTLNIIDFDRVKEIEKQTKHDVVAHLQHWNEICNDVHSTIHIGATSSFVVDNAECMLYKEALLLVIQKLNKLYQKLWDLSYKYANTPVVGYTHFQPASPTTIGKRIALWMQDLYDDYYNLISIHDNLKCRGVKGSTGTQLSYYVLSNYNETLVKRLDRIFAKKLKFKSSIDISGQTLTRKQDVKIVDAISSLAISLSKMAHDIRLLSHTKDMSEKFTDNQVGSSAMPYKRNPIKSEKICGLSRIIVQHRNTIAQTAMTQWLERSLDDSSVKRIIMPEIFMLIDAILETTISIINNVVITPQTDMPENIYLASEILLMIAVKNGYDARYVHHKLKHYALEAYKNNDINIFCDRILNDDIWKNNNFAKNIKNFNIKDATGLAYSQTIGFLKRHKIDKL